MPHASRKSVLLRKSQQEQPPHPGRKTNDGFFRVGVQNNKMEYVYVSISICVAIAGAITDIFYGRVKNRHLVYALVCWLCALLIDLCIHKRISADIGAIALNMSLSAVMTAILYMKDIWAPGDGKLFMLISLIYPLSLSPCYDGNVFPSLDIAIYSFAVGYIYLLVAAIFKRNKSETAVDATNVRSFFQWTRISSIVLNIGFISLINIALQRWFADFQVANSSLCSLCIIGLVYLLNRVNPIVRKICGCIGLCVLLIFTQVNGEWISLLSIILKSSVISVLIEILNMQIGKNSYRTVSGSEIKTGMILSQTTIWEMQNCIDPDLPRSTTETRRSRLTPAQAQAVRLWSKNSKCDITIVEMLPFAPCIALAMIIHFIRFMLIYR